MLIIYIGQEELVEQVYFKWKIGKKGKVISLYRNKNKAMIDEL